MNDLVPAVFCAPRYIEALGCDGLSSDDIASSLGTEGKKVRQKLGSREFGDTMSSLGLRVLSVTLKNINGVEYEEYYLDTAASKFFVARYENDMGNAYLAYLVHLDMAVEKKCREYRDAHKCQLEKVALLEESLNEPITGEEISLLIRTVNSNLKRHGKHNKKSYKTGFNYEIISKFYLKGEDPDTYTYLPRKNFKDALLYARDRRFDWRTNKEFG